ncbi:hypothetical protein JJB07_03130 [Tumebacillus sp. ITR2]|uniref:DUF4131 domain-containing protein n=1 Tax=Tumebacillus amylolyticus TaxID=2801339 RepID=A0ABS1J5V9_9BACL|nr:hypothetical protein [Tumebacillus amylolyticus]MBL0385634.1 hypothetical protein [Tumebacillus amylolyticus]
MPKLNVKLQSTKTFFVSLFAIGPIWMGNYEQLSAVSLILGDRIWLSIQREEQRRETKAAWVATGSLAVSVLLLTGFFVFSPIVVGGSLVAAAFLLIGSIWGVRKLVTVFPQGTWYEKAGLESRTVARAAGQTLIVKNTVSNVPKEQTLQTLVVLNHDAKIEGRVTDVVFVYNGDVQLTSTSKTGVVVVLGGHNQQENGAYVEDGIAAVTFDFVAGRHPCFAGPSVMPFQGQERLDWWCWLGGLGISLLLALSVFGAPLARLFGVVLLLLFAVGYTLVAYHVGKIVVGGRAFSNGIWRPTFLGSVTIVALSNIPLFGALLLLIVLVLSIGTSTVWLWQKRAKR